MPVNHMPDYQPADNRKSYYPYSSPRSSVHIKFPSTFRYCLLIKLPTYKVPSETSQNINYIPQLLQLEAPQLEQELPPTGALSPISFVEKQAKVDSFLSAVFRQ